VVAQITEGTAFDKHGRPFRRRNARPAIALLIVLLLASAVVWTIALTRPAEVHEATVCNPPPEQADPAQPVYTNTRLTCQGQIRFGEAGQASAAAVWLVTPCAELYRDDRTDDSVDLAIGTEFGALAHSDDISLVLAGLRPGATEPADPALLAKIHAGNC
jgi:hypothetical protein